eukprot:TRINITY_DN11590_c0_g1_i2.p1 TRINITY_DN11590_c0_g1~~TRINITY_DN11590_c0_g1_i2.p1  ORF type:complete len:222 (-),score=38.19 TRINITY_DN11590_c0_g1_i2:24-620(-)
MDIAGSPFKIAIRALTTSSACLTELSIRLPVAFLDSGFNDFCTVLSSGNCKHLSRFGLSAGLTAVQAVMLKEVIQTFNSLLSLTVHLLTPLSGGESATGNVRFEEGEDDSESEDEETETKSSNLKSSESIITSSLTHHQSLEIYELETAKFLDCAILELGCVFSCGQMNDKSAPQTMHEENHKRAKQYIWRRGSVSRH